MRKILLLSLLAINLNASIIDETVNYWSKVGINLKTQITLTSKKVENDIKKEYYTLKGAYYKYKYAKLPKIEQKITIIKADLVNKVESNTNIKNQMLNMLDSFKAKVGGLIKTTGDDINKGLHYVGNKLQDGADELAKKTANGFWTTLEYITGVDRAELKATAQIGFGYFIYNKVVPDEFKQTLHKKIVETTKTIVAKSVELVKKEALPLGKQLFLWLIGVLTGLIAMLKEPFKEPQPAEVI